MNRDSILSNPIIRGGGQILRLAFLFLSVTAGSSMLFAVSPPDLPTSGQPDETGVYQITCRLYPTPRSGGDPVLFAAGIHVNEGIMHVSTDKPWDAGSTVAQATCQMRANVPQAGTPDSPKATIAGRVTGLVVDEGLGQINGMCAAFPLAKLMTGQSPNAPTVTFQGTASFHLEFKIEGNLYVLEIQVSYFVGGRSNIIVTNPTSQPTASTP